MSMELGLNNNNNKKNVIIQIFDVTFFFFLGALTQNIFHSRLFYLYQFFFKTLTTKPKKV